MSGTFLPRVLPFLIASSGLMADQIPVRHLEGRVHGFLVLRDTGGDLLASGTSMQRYDGNRVTNELSFRFKDGSVHQETAVFSQRKLFRLLSYHLVQKGPTFKRAMDVSVNATSGDVVIKYTEDDGKEKTISERMKLPPDLANGMVTTLLGDIDPKALKSTVSMFAATPKPRLVKLEISPAGDDTFTVGGVAGKARRFVVHVDIGGISGVIAPLIGKQPPDVQVWIATGGAPGFVKSEGPLFADGPPWRIEFASPVWPKGSTSEKE